MKVSDGLEVGSIPTDSSSRHSLPVRFPNAHALLLSLLVDQ